MVLVEKVELVLGLHFTSQVLRTLEDEWFVRMALLEPGWSKALEKALPNRWSVYASSQRCGAGSDGDHSLRKSHHGSRISERIPRVRDRDPEWCIRVESGGPFAFSPQLTGFIGQNCEPL